MGWDGHKNFSRVSGRDATGEVAPEQAVLEIGSTFRVSLP
jgi:hypothetical protein